MNCKSLKCIGSPEKFYKKCIISIFETLKYQKIKMFLKHPKSSKKRWIFVYNENVKMFYILKWNSLVTSFKLYGV